ncbi:hypothetical protein ACW95P_04200 [Candidatus Mycoplasma pogonae]
MEKNTQLNNVEETQKLENDKTETKQKLFQKPDTITVKGKITFLNLAKTFKNKKGKEVIFREFGLVPDGQKQGQAFITYDLKVMNEIKYLDKGSKVKMKVMPVDKTWTNEKTGEIIPKIEWHVKELKTLEKVSNNLQYAKELLFANPINAKENAERQEAQETKQKESEDEWSIELK